MENKINILANTLEQMLADCEDNGRDGIQPKLTPDDVALIIKALNHYEDLCQSCVNVAAQTCGAFTDIYQTNCKECIHAPICEYCNNHLENFSLPRNAEACAMYEPDSLDAVDLEEVCEVRKFTSPFVDTVDGMLSPDYKERFRAEYAQTKIRYERLKAFNTKIEAANRTNEWRCRYEMPKVEMPKHDCPDDILEQQQHLMGQYLHILEVRAVIEGVDLGGC